MGLENLSTGTMSTVKQRRFPLFVLVFAVFLLVSPVVLWTVGLLTARTYFIACFVWLLISSEVFVPTDPDAVWWSRLQWVKAVGWVVLAYIVFERVIAVIQ